MWKLRLSIVVVWVLLFAEHSLQGMAADETARPDADRSVDFVTDVQPILRSRCLECHANGNEEGGLNLGIRARALAGSENGAIIVPQHSEDSLLLQLVSGQDPDRTMPPDGQPLPPFQIEILRRWIDQGAHWPAGADIVDAKRDQARHHWAFQRLGNVEPPVRTRSAAESNPDTADWSVTAIDRFVRQPLDAAQLQPTPAAPDRVLLRRICFGLTGLPPTLEQVAQFVAVAELDRVTAVEQLTEELLASPHYGERWARHWLDVARYADSDGQESDRDRPTAYPYRDFVIRSLNEDRPFDTFVRWQIAGDEIEPDNAAAVSATGFLVAGTHTVLADKFLEEERLRNRYNELDDIVSTLGSGLLGLTVGCARCHDHKFDAISSRDYYQLIHVFHSGDRHSGEIPGGRHALVFRDFGTEPKTSWLFERGDFYDRDEEVSLGFPSILCGGRTPEDYWQAAKAAKDPATTNSTLQRRALADWITDADQGAGALLARVIVNRVWHHHFGAGLVRTTSDFGVRGDEPSHPELLEWLTADLIRHGWQLKRLHRLIINSAVYQQDTTTDAASSTIDPDNRLLWRRVPQRLEAEIIRDSMLAVSGTLNRQAWGPGFKPPISPEAIVARNLKGGGYPEDATDSPATRRRSVYMFHKRLVPYPLFQAFDRPDLLQTCARRENTTVAPQGLALLNDEFVRLRSADFADRLLQRAGSDDHQIVEHAFELALSRQPDQEEQQAAQAFLTSQTKRRTARGDQQARKAAVTDFCQSIFGLNEFLYVD